jgi:stress response protein YsnF
MANTVVGIFDGAREAENAVEKLVASGISRNNIDITSGATGSDSSYVSNERSGSSDSRIIGDRRVVDDDGEARTVDSKGRNTNRITDFFNSLFGHDSDDAKRHASVGSNSHSIVTVHAQTGDEAETAASILDDCGAVDVDERATQYGFERTSGNREEETSIPRIEENLEVGKRSVETGGVRVRSRIVDRPVEENIRLREENVRVERNPVDRPVSSSDMENFQERDIELTERSEVPVVNKEARVVEEVRVSKEVNERNETVRDNVRETKVDVENIEGERNRNTDSNLDDDSRNSRNII